MPGCGAEPLGTGSLFSSVAPALRHAAFEQGAVRYSAATVTLLNEIGQEPESKRMGPDSSASSALVSFALGFH